MSVLNFVTRKLKTQSLGTDEEDTSVTNQGSHATDLEDNISVQDDRDENEPPLAAAADVSQTSFAQPWTCSGPNREISLVASGSGHSNNMATLEDGYSSEEELKEINSSKRQKKQQKARSSKPRTYSATAVTPSRSCMYSSASSGGGVGGSGSRSSSSRAVKSVLGCTINNSQQHHAAEKRKWADSAAAATAATDSCGQYYFGSSSSDLSSTPKPPAQSSSAAIRRCRSSLSAPSYNLSFSRPTSRAQSTALAPLEGAEVVLQGGRDSRNLDTPVQFCTSPPVDVHRPKRQANMMAPPPANMLFGRSPPTKMFHFQPLERPTTKYHGPATDDEDSEVCAATAGRSLEIDYGEESEGEDVPPAGGESGTVPSSPQGQENVASATSPPAIDISSLSSSRPQQRSQKPSHLLRRSQSQLGLHHHFHRKAIKSPAGNKKLKGARSKRPSLDFEKMQQIKKQVVTSWRPQGGETSLFNW